MENCSECGREIDRLEVFANGECLECHAKAFTMPTAQEVRAMWGIR